MDEKKYVGLLESLKKNEAVREFVVRILIETFEETRMVKRILEIMTEKYAKGQERE